MAQGFGLGAGTLALWMGTARHEVRVGHYNTRMVAPLSWDDEEGGKGACFRHPRRLQPRETDAVAEAEPRRGPRTRGRGRGLAGPG